MMSELRVIKTVEELDCLRIINKIAEKAHYYAAKKATDGISELQYAQYISEYLFSEGAESINKLVVGSGERSEHGNANPTARIMQNGEIVRADIFAKLHGYMSDVARTAVVGKPVQYQMEKWKKIVESRSIVIDMIKPGAFTGDIYKAFCGCFDEAGLTPINFVGHGLGITLHEDPYISRYHNLELQSGMVLAIEPIYFAKGEGYQIEDIITVTNNGCEVFTNFGDPNQMIEISSHTY